MSAISMIEEGIAFAQRRAAFLVPATMRDASLVYYVDVCGAVYFSY